MKKIFFSLLVVPFFVCSQSSMNMNLLGTYNYSTTQGNDIWGWVDGNSNEYALVGLRSGFSVVNVTNPSSPYEEFFISDINSTWRDIKTYGNYAYVTTEANAGLLIVDLNDMSGGTYTHVTQFSNLNGNTVSFTAAHNIYIDENGIAYIFGASGQGPQSDGAIFLDVASNPTSPIYLGEWDEHYIHDGMVRGDTMWAGCIYAGKVFAVDVSDKSNPITIGSHATPNNFTHNAWISDNGDFVFTTDEQSDAYLTAYDVSDINNIQEVDRIQSNPGSNSIPHNTHVDGNFLITSYYRDGTTVHDITHPHYMIEVAYYDSYAGFGNGFDGCWGTYPFLPSGNIISSDINSGPGGKGRLLIYGRDFQQACYLQGNVADGLTSNPINNAAIEILNTSITTATNLIGFYQTASVDSGTFQIIFSAAGYVPDTLTAVLTNGVMTVLDASLFPPCNTFNVVTNNVQICSNSSYSIGNSTYTNSGTYSDTLINSLGCDSIINTNLTVLPTSTFTQAISICDGSSIVVGNNVYTQTGIYTDVFVSENGCDSIVTTNLTVFASYFVSNPQSICNGESYYIGSSSYSNPGNYTDLLNSVNGCDSIVNTILTVFPAPVTSSSYTICDGEYVQIGNNIYHDPGEYTDTLVTIYGCDSIINTSIILSIPTSQLNQSGLNIDYQGFNGTSPYVYDLYGPNGILSSMQNSGVLMQFSPSENGMYYFIVTDALGCVSDTSFFYVDFILTDLSPLRISNFVIYPNPFETVFNVSFNFENSQIFDVRVLNTIGETIFIDDLKQFTGRYSRQFNLKDYSKGIYFLHIKTEHGVLNRKIIFQ